MVKNAFYHPKFNLFSSAFGETLVVQPSPRVLIHFPYNLNTDIVTTSNTGSGTVTHSNHFAVIQSGAATSSSGTLESKGLLEYNPGTGGLARFTAIFDTPADGNTQIAGIGSSTDGYFFGYNGETFGILHRARGSDSWIPQDTWNGNQMLGNERYVQTLVPQNGNVYQIRYQWLGFGAIQFCIENSESGQFCVVHTIYYANKNTSVSVNNPTFPFYCISSNTTNSTNVQIKVPSIGLYIEGMENNVGEVRNAIDNTKTGVTTETNIITIRNKTTYQSENNRVIINPDLLTMAVDGTKNSVLRVWLNATLGGSPSYTDISTNTSVVEYDTAGTTVSGGKLVGSFAVSKAGSLVQEFRDFNLLLNPGSTITITAESSASTDATAAIAWAERFK